MPILKSSNETLKKKNLTNSKYLKAMVQKLVSIVRD